MYLNALVIHNKGDWFKHTEDKCNANHKNTNKYDNLCLLGEYIHTHKPWLLSKHLELSFQKSEHILNSKYYILNEAMYVYIMYE